MKRPSDLLVFAVCVMVWAGALGYASGEQDSPHPAKSDDAPHISHKKECAKTMTVTKEPLGKTLECTKVDQYTLRNAAGLRVTIMTFGATITSVCVPDRHGKLDNIVLSLDGLDDYLKGHPYFGSTVGRYANRIAKARFTINGVEYKLAANNGPNHLHGGIKGFDKVVWKAEPMETDNSVGVTFSHDSHDGEEGYPGHLVAKVAYSLTSDNELKMAYSATTDKPTVVNLTNHTYWNLAGGGSGDVLGHEVLIDAGKYLPVDDNLIPLGEPRSVKDSPMDFTRPRTIGSRIERVDGGYDHCYVLNRSGDKKLSLAARVVEPSSGRAMEIYTTQPAIQFYTGNFLDGTLSVGGKKCRKHFGFCLETQHYPDSPNRPAFPSTLLKPGEKYTQLTVHRFIVEQ
jgi:aldose 1-epimerase